MKKYICELVGTLLLVLLGCLAAVYVKTSPEITVALVFGLVIVVLAYVFGPLSGCHLNPAVTIAMLINKRISFKDSIFYIINQIIGGIIGSALVVLIIKFATNGDYTAIQNTGLGANSVGGENAIILGLTVEALLTFVFVSVIMTATGKKGNSNISGLIIGLTLTLCIIVGFNLTGGSLNPARSIGPAIFAEGIALEQIWIFIIGPIIGAIGATIFARFILGSEDSK